MGDAFADAATEKRRRRRSSNTDGHPMHGNHVTLVGKEQQYRTMRVLCPLPCVTARHALRSHVLDAASVATDDLGRKPTSVEVMVNQQMLINRVDRRLTAPERDRFD